MAKSAIAIEAMLDIPYFVDCGDRRIVVYPPSLGISLMVEKMQSSIDINREMLETFPNVEMLALSEKYPDELATIVALHTFKERRDAIDADKLETRIEEITMSAEDLAVAYARVMSFPTPEYYLRELGIADEIERRQRIAECKKPSTSMNTGATTLYGGLIDVACERYGWTYDYVMWGITLHNLRLLLADISNDVFLTEEEYKRARRYVRKGKARKGCINADDPKNIDKIVEFFKDMD